MKVIRIATAYDPHMSMYGMLINLKYVFDDSYWIYFRMYEYFKKAQRKQL